MANCRTDMTDLPFHSDEGFEQDAPYTTKERTPADALGYQADKHDRVYRFQHTGDRWLNTLESPLLEEKAA